MFLQFFKRFCVVALLSFVSLANCQNPVAAQLGYPLSNNPDDIQFLFFPINGTPDNPHEIVYGESDSLTRSGFNYSASKTVFLIHGFTDNATIHLDKDVLPVYLASNLTYNYIIVNWGLLSGNTPFTNDAQSFAIYNEVVNTSIPIVVKRTTDFIIFLGLDPLTVHIVGHSLGAHVSGNVGGLYQSKVAGPNNIISRITGLDPAGPLFTTSIPYPKINKTNALFVDILHTNMGMAGDVSVDGHIDFYANGGVNQPNCDLYSDVGGSNACSHQFAPILYAASISKVILGQFCLSSALVTGAVGLTGVQTQQGINVQLCSAASSVQFGEYCPSTARGLYSITVGNPP